MLVSIPALVSSAFSLHCRKHPRQMSLSSVPSCLWDLCRIRTLSVLQLSQIWNVDISKNRARTKIVKLKLDLIHFTLASIHSTQLEIICCTTRAMCKWLNRFSLRRFDSSKTSACVKSKIFLSLLRFSSPTESAQQNCWRAGRNIRIISQPVSFLGHINFILTGFSA